MEILIGLAIATVLVIGWAKGNLFACVFLSLGLLLGALFSAVIMFSGQDWGAILFVICLALLAGVWGPRYYYVRRYC